MAQHEVITEQVPGHASPDDQYLSTPPGAEYEHTDANVWVVVKFVVALAVAAAIIHFGLAMLFNLLVARRVERTTPQYPLAVQNTGRLPPEPRLQRFPREDILNFRLAEEAVLSSYGWVDKTAGTVRIPIDEAMKLTLQRGLPSRPGASAGAPVSAMPTDASAGRKMERPR